MIVIIQLLIIVILASITWQDFKYRAVYWILLPLLMLLFILKGVFNNTFSIYDSLINLFMIALQIIVLHIYIYMKSGAWLLHKYYLGWGDVLFFIALTFLFSPITFMAFQLISLISILLWFILFNKFLTRQKLIPLAGCQSFILILLITYESVSGTTNLTIDGFILDNLKMYAQ